MRDVSYTITAYNRLELLKEHLKALENQSGLNKIFNLEVVVAADHCEDGTNEFLQDYILEELPFDFKFVILTDKKGDQAARNEAVKQCTHEIIIIGDDDRIPDPGFVRALSEWVKVGQVAIGNQDNWVSYPNSEQKKRPPDWREFVTGAVGVSKTDLYLVGGFDEGLEDRWGFGDVDMGWRLYLLGCKFKFVKSATHKHKNEDYNVNPRSQDQKNSEAQINKKYLSDKYGIRWPPNDMIGRSFRYPNTLDLVGYRRQHSYL